MCIAHASLEEAIKEWWNISMNATAMYRVTKNLRHAKDMVKK